jgi:hypothetical protein
MVVPGEGSGAGAIPHPEVGQAEMLKLRAAAAAQRIPSLSLQSDLTTPEKRRQAIDAVWGDGLPTADKLALFDKFWKYADEKFAAFQGIVVDWAALRFTLSIRNRGRREPGPVRRHHEPNWPWRCATVTHKPSIVPSTSSPFPNAACRCSH